MLQLIPARYFGISVASSLPEETLRSLLCPLSSLLSVRLAGLRRSSGEPDDEELEDGLGDPFPLPRGFFLSLTVLSEECLELFPSSFTVSFETLVAANNSSSIPKAFILPDLWSDSDGVRGDLFR